MSFFDGVTPRTVADAASGFKEFRIGDNEAFIKTVKEKISESGNAMLEITFGDDEGAEVRYYIVEGEYKMQKLKGLYLSFGIPMANTDTASWVGKRGVVVCKQGEPYNGKAYNKVSFLRPLPHANLRASPELSAHAPPPHQPEDDFVDDIPF